MEDVVDLIPFDFSVSSLLAGLIFGSIGLWLFRRARRQAHTLQVLIAIALMIYPYLVKGPLADWGVGFALCGLAYYLEKNPR